MAFKISVDENIIFRNQVILVIGQDLADGVVMFVNGAPADAGFLGDFDEGGSAFDVENGNNFLLGLLETAVLHLLSEGGPCFSHG